MKELRLLTLNRYLMVLRAVNCVLVPLSLLIVRPLLDMLSVLGTAVSRS